MTLARITRQTIDTIGQQESLEAASQRLQQAVNNLFDAGGGTGQQIENFLHGVPLGHPLHPVLTDIPIGAWTAAAAIDVLEGISGNRQLGPGADAAIAVGLVGAVGAAITGLTDWKDTDGASRRVGLVHGLLNLSATLLYTQSLIARRAGARARGRSLSFAGYATVLVSALLGGDLVYRQRIGVSHLSQEELPTAFVPVLNAAELGEGEMRRVEANGVTVVLVRQQDQIYALAERCSHMGGPLADGHLYEGSLQCPWHGSRFALADGHVLDGPATFPQPCFETRIRDGQIEVRTTLGASHGEVAF